MAQRIAWRQTAFRGLVLALASAFAMPAEPLTILSPTTLPAGSTFRPYKVTLAVQGGSGIFKWQVVAGVSPVPIGSYTGMLSGIPSTPGAFRFTVRVVDLKTEESAEAQLEVEIASTPGYTRLTLEGAMLSAAAINNKGEVAGTASIGGKSRGFLRRANGEIELFDVAGAPTTATGLNDRGDIVGTFSGFAYLRDSQGNVHSFDSFSDGSVPVSINNQRVVAANLGTTSFLYADGLVTWIRISRNVNLSAINSLGQALGWRNYDFPIRFLFLRDPGGTITDLGQYDDHGGNYLTGEKYLGLNGKGIVIGENTIMRLGEPSIATPFVAIGINDNGTILGKDYLFTPCPGDAGSRFLTGGGPEAGAVSVTQDDGCLWFAETQESWIRLRRSVGLAGSPLQFVLSANPGPLPRRGVISVADGTLEVIQDAPGCDFTVSPDRALAVASGGEVEFSVRTGPGCHWSAAATEPWLEVSGWQTGAGTVVVRTPANPSFATRTATVTIAGREIPFSQSGLACTYAIEDPGSFPVAGGRRVITVDLPRGCTYRAASLVPWIGVSPETGSWDNPKVTVTVDRNTTGEVRSGAIDIAGQRFQVVQLGSSLP